MLGSEEAGNTSRRREGIELRSQPQQCVVENTSERIQLRRVLSNLISFMPLAGPRIDFGAERLQLLARLGDPQALREEFLSLVGSVSLLSAQRHPTMP